MNILLIVILVLLLAGSGPWAPWSAGLGLGYGAPGVLGVVLVVVLILAVMGRL